MPTAEAVVIRPVEVNDVDRLSYFYAGLSPESRHLRFLGLVDGPTATDLEAFCRPDRMTCDGFLALAHPSAWEGPEVVGHLCLGLGGPATMEVGLAVADQWRGRGVGMALAERGLAWARQRDVHFIGGATYVHDAGVFRLLASLGLQYRVWWAGAGVVELLVDPGRPPEAHALPGHPRLRSAGSTPASNGRDSRRGPNETAR